VHADEDEDVDVADQTLSLLRLLPDAELSHPRFGLTRAQPPGVIRVQHNRKVLSLELSTPACVDD
jgi:hypothetical protein